MSWFISSSYAPKPSVSIKKTGNGVLLWLFDIIKGSVQIQIPFVQGLNVGPTSKPFILFFSSKTRFNKKDFPVRYFPTKLIMPIFSLDWFIKRLRASSGIINLLSTKDINGIAWFLGMVISFCSMLFSESWIFELIF